MTSALDKNLRAFCMSAAQIQSELASVERDQGIQVRAARSKTRARKQEDYKSFEADVRRDAALMSEYYEIFFCLEVSIRRLISSIMTEAEGAGWWNSSRVAEGIKNDVAAIQKREDGSAINPRSENPLDYTTFGQLSQIITDNFDLFESVISSKPATSRVLNQLNLLRGGIAHCCVLAPDEQERLELSVRDWFRLLS